MKHPIVPPQARSLEMLGKKIAELRYDAQLVVFASYKAEMLRQAEKDGVKERHRLGGLGRDLTETVSHSVVVLEKMFQLSLPFMRDELDESPLP